MSQHEGTPYRRHIQIGCAAFVLLVAMGAYFSWMKMRRLYDFQVPPEARVYDIQPGKDTGDVTVQFWVDRSEDKGILERVLSLNPGDGKPQVEKKVAWRKDTDKIVRVTLVSENTYSLVIDRQ